jgi:D-alanyl-D-alanine carboxypeptidase
VPINRNVRRSSLLAAFLSAAFLASAASAQSSPRQPEKFDLAAIDAYLADYVREKGLVGLSVAIMREGDVVFAKGYGQRSLEKSLPVEPETSFAVASVTKQFVCACVLLLAEEGKLSIDDPVAKYYPHLTRAADITLLDLMSHTSGYPDFYPLDFVDRRMSMPISFAELTKQYAGGQLDFEPGSRYSYSNTGYIILGGVIERVSGHKCGDFLQQRILTPLKMEHSRFGTAAGLASPATGYNAFALGSPEPALPEADGWIEAAGGLWASAPDLLRWDLALVTGKVLKPESYERIIAPRKLTSGKASNYGCGIVQETHSGEVVLRHTGGVSGFASYNALLPRTKSGVVVLSNTEHVSTVPLRTELLKLLVRDIETDDAPAVPKIAGPDAKTVVLEFLKQMQAGQIDRSRLGEEFNHYLSAERVAAAAERMRTLGEPQHIEVDSPGERGGMEVVNVHLTFPSAKLRASLYRLPSGQIEQLLFYKE